MNIEIISSLQEIVGKTYVFTDFETLQEYGKDHTEDLLFPPQVVVKPSTPQEISEILKLAYSHGIAVTPIGARTGLSGGMLSVFGGIGLSMERFDKILFIDEKNFQVTVEPGVITEVLQNEVAKKGMFYPVDPSSKGSCFIGGNVAENAGGARAVKYGVTKDYVLNLEVVLPTGEIIWTGANTLKNATGYNLTQLMVGSEGTLGIITKIVMKLIPQVSHNVLLLVPFYDMLEATEAVSAIFRAQITPSALEFMEREAIDWTIKFYDAPNVPLNTGIEAYLLIELDGNSLENIMQDVEKLVPVLESYKIEEILFAETDDQKNALWRLRRNIAEAVKQKTVYKEEDTVVPRHELPVLLKQIKSIGDKYGFRSICYGHAGDGNLHVNIIKEDLSDEIWKQVIPKAITEIFEFTVALKGTLSGEHGIGWVQKSYMPIAFSPIQLQLMKAIKQVFDPKMLLNPGKIFD